MHFSYATTKETDTVNEFHFCVNNKARISLYLEKVWLEIGKR